MSASARASEVEALPGFRLKITFTDGAVREVDLSDQLWGPVFEGLRDPDAFAAVRVDPDFGGIEWPNGGDLDPDVLRGFAVAEEAATHPRRGNVPPTPQEFEAE